MRLLASVSLALLLPNCIGSSSASKKPPRVEMLDTIETPPGRIHSLQTWGRYVAWVSATRFDGSDESSHPDQVVLHDMDSDTTRVVARTDFPETGVITRFRGGRDGLVYVDYEGRSSDETVEEATRWKMYLLFLSDGERRLIAESATAEDEQYPAHPSFAWPWIVWTRVHHVDEGGVSVHAYNVQTKKHTVVATSTNAYQLAVDNETLTVYFDTVAQERVSDIYAVPVDGSTSPRRVTTSGRAAFPMAGNGGVAWQEPPQGDSESLWYMSARRGVPVVFARATGVPPGHAAVPGHGFVVWAWNKLLVARPALDSPRRHLNTTPKTHIDTSARWSVYEDRVAWAEMRGWDIDAVSTVKVARVRS